MSAPPNGKENDFDADFDEDSKVSECQQCEDDEEDERDPALVQKIRDLTSTLPDYLKDLVIEGYEDGKGYNKWDDYCIRSLFKQELKQVKQYLFVCPFCIFKAYKREYYPHLRQAHCSGRNRQRRSCSKCECPLPNDEHQIELHQQQCHQENYMVGTLKLLNLLNTKPDIRETFRFYLTQLYPKDPKLSSTSREQKNRAGSNSRAPATPEISEGDNETQLHQDYSSNVPEPPPNVQPSASTTTTQRRSSRIQKSLDNLTPQHSSSLDESPILHIPLKRNRDPSFFSSMNRAAIPSSSTSCPSNSVSTTSRAQNYSNNIDAPITSGIAKMTKDTGEAHSKTMRKRAEMLTKNLAKRAKLMDTGFTSQQEKHEAERHQKEMENLELEEKRKQEKHEAEMERKRIQIEKEKTEMEKAKIELEEMKKRQQP